jgi:cysteine desulfurase
MDSPIYLDHNATTPLLPEVCDAMIPYLREHFGNPSSNHAYGKRANEAVQHARTQVAALIGCGASEVIFTSGGTEANNLAIRGIVEHASDRPRVVTSTIEHPATSRPCAWLRKQGREVVAIGVDRFGRLDLDAAQLAIDASTALVTVMHSNNETGVLQPIRELSEHARKSGVYTHTDAAQSVGKVEIDVKDLGIDTLSIAGHKLYAPKGVGALYVREGTPVAPFMLGAGHEGGRRPGTENVASIVGLGVACEVALRDLATESARVRALRDRLWLMLHERIEGLRLNGHEVLRLPNTLNLRFPRVSGTRLLAATPEIAASTGSACHSGGETPSAVVLAMGVPESDARGSVRLTLGRRTAEHDVSIAVNALVRAWRELS